MGNKYRFYNIWDLKIEKFTSHVNVVIIKWREEFEEGSAIVERAIQTIEQYDAVVQEFTDKLAFVYRPES